MAEVTTRRLIITGPEMSEPLIVPVSLSGSASIGRQSDNSLQVHHPLVSRKHAELKGTLEGCQITDLGSTYGTTVNGRKLTPHTAVTLNDGDVIEVGPYRLVYEQETRQESTPSERTQGRRRRPRPPKPPPPIPPEDSRNGSANGILPPGLYLTYSRYLKYLPEIYHTEFMGRFLALFESILAPIEWNVNNFDLYLDPEAAPTDFLPWLADWFEIIFDESWTEEQRRELLREAHAIYARRGTAGALERILEIYTGVIPRIDDLDESLDPFTFVVMIPRQEQELNRTLIERIIDANKPAHTNYRLIFAR